MKLYETAYCLVTVTYAFSYLCYINILQAVWSFKHNLEFDCPILDRKVSLPVYIRNRQLIRHKQILNVVPHERFYSCADALDAINQADGGSKKVPLLEWLSSQHDSEEYRERAQQHFEKYERYKSRILTSDEILRMHILMAFLS